MGLIRGLLFDNLGLKLVALLLALVVYLHVYTEREATMVVAFPIQVSDLADSLTLSGPAPTAVLAELRGTGKQMIRLRLTEPRLRVSLAGVGPGLFTHRVTEQDLPLMADDRLQVTRMLGPTALDFTLDRRITRRIPVAPRVEGEPDGAAEAGGPAAVQPAEVVVRGPARVLAAMDSLALEPVSIEGRRETLRATVGAGALPEWCTVEPAKVQVTVPLRRRGS